MRSRPLGVVLFFVSVLLPIGAGYLILGHDAESSPDRTLACKRVDRVFETSTGNIAGYAAALELRHRVERRLTAEVNALDLEEDEDRLRDRFLVQARKVNSHLAAMSRAFAANQRQELADLRAINAPAEARRNRLAERGGWTVCGTGFTRAGASANPNRELPDELFSGGRSITELEALKIIGAFWQARENAISNSDLAALRRLDTGVAREADVGETLGYIARGLVIADREIHGFSAMVPGGSGFPQHFIGEARTTAPPQLGTLDPGAIVDEYVLLARPGPRQPWRASLITGVPEQEDPFDPYLSSAAEVDPLLNSVPESKPKTPTWIEPAQVLRRLARYYQHWKDHGAPPPNSQFRPGIWTTEHGQLTAEVPQGGLTEEGVRQTLHYSVDARDDVFSIPLEHGATLVCGTVRGASVYAPGSAPLVEDRYLSHWAGQLSPGEYRSINTLTRRQTCVWVGRTPGEGLDVVGSLGRRTATGQPVGTETGL